MSRLTEDNPDVRVVAFTTFALMKAPYGTEVVRGFEDLTPPVFAAAEESDGFIARGKEIDDRPNLTNAEREWGKWGPFCTPRFYEGGATRSTDTRASTVSLWRDLLSVHRFAYSGIHREALLSRHEWFLKTAWPSYAIWWVDRSHIPTWSDACARLEHLYDHGSSPTAFDFRRPYDELGRPISLPGLVRSSV